MISWRLAPLIALGLSAALCGGLGAYGFLRPGQAMPEPFDFAYARDVRAAEAGAAGELDLAQQETRAMLARSPLSSVAWARMGWLEHQRASGFSAASTDAFLRSYAAAPYGPVVTRWRLAFIFNRWPDVPMELKERAIEEFTVLARRRRRAAREVTESITDPAGRMAAALLLDAAIRAAARESATRSTL